VIPQIKISAGELFELIKPAVLVLSALLSTWVFASARKRFSFLFALLWALASFFLTPIVLPLYLIVLLFRRDITHPQLRWKLLAPLVYALLVLAGVGLYLRQQNQGVDFHLARAEHSKLRGDRAETIAQYRAALLEQDDAHTRKLLGIELYESGYWTESLGELRKAEQQGESDDLVIFRIATLLDLLNLTSQAQVEYKRFLESGSCVQPLPDPLCETARKRIKER
jgi:hypothetical protein